MNRSKEKSSNAGTIGLDGYVPHARGINLLKTEISSPDTQPWTDQQLQLLRTVLSSTGFSEISGTELGMFYAEWDNLETAINSPLLLAVCKNSKFNDAVMVLNRMGGLDVKEYEFFRISPDKREEFIRLLGIHFQIDPSSLRKELFNLNLNNRPVDQEG